jgi:hypothetical protein
MQAVLRLGFTGRNRTARRREKHARRYRTTDSGTTSAQKSVTERREALAVRGWLPG